MKAQYFLVKKTSVVIVATLELVALVCGILTSMLLQHRETPHVILLTIVLCILASIIGIAVTHLKQRLLFVCLILAGLLSLFIGAYTRIALVYHERAALALGVGLLCVLGGIAGFVAQG